MAWPAKNTQVNMYHQHPEILEGYIAQAGVLEVKVKGVKIKGTLRVEWLRQVIKTDLKCPLILGIWKISNDLSSQFDSSGKHGSYDE